MYVQITDKLGCPDFIPQKRGELDKRIFSEIYLDLLTCIYLPKSLFICIPKKLIMSNRCSRRQFQSR